MSAVSDDKGPTNLFGATYARDANGQVTSDSSAAPAQTAYRYTSLNQVCYAGSSNTTACSSAPLEAQPFTYDAADNLTLLGSTDQAFDAADQLCWTGSSSGTCSSPPVGATTYSYDPRGNRTSAAAVVSGTTAYTYDQANRLTADGSAATYAYNGDGLRMSKTLAGAATTQDAWNTSDGLPTLVQDGNTSYVDGPGGLPLEQITGSAALWYHHDQLGSTRLLTNAAGTPTATYTFDPYGNLTASTGTATNPFLYAGQYRDTESGFYYLRARYYEPATAQFLSRDPAVAVTREPYAYVAGNPLNGTDPSGMDEWASDSSTTPLTAAQEQQLEELMKATGKLDERIQDLKADARDEFESSPSEYIGHMRSISQRQNLVRRLFNRVKDWCPRSATEMVERGLEFDPLAERGVPQGFENQLPPELSGASGGFGGPGEGGGPEIGYLRMTELDD